RHAAHPGLPPPSLHDALPISSMVLRRIRMDLDGWDEADRSAREQSTGTRMDSGAPLTGGTEFSPPDFTQVSANGFPVIGEFSHRSEEHTSELQSRFDLVCRLL